MGDKLNCWIWICSSCLARYLCKYLVHLTTLSILWPEGFSTPCISRYLSDDLVFACCFFLVLLSLVKDVWIRPCSQLLPDCHGKKMSRVSRSFYDQFRMINLTMPSQYHVNPWKPLIGFKMTGRFGVWMSFSVLKLIRTAAWDRQLQMNLSFWQMLQNSCPQTKVAPSKLPHLTKKNDNQIYFRKVCETPSRHLRLPSVI